MGNWGYNLLDNDAALDIKIKWEKELKKYLEKYPEWKGQEVVDFYLENHFDYKFEYGDVYNNSEILALAKLLFDNNFELPNKFKRVVEDVLTLELQDEALSEWDYPEKRKKTLLAFIESINGNIQDIDELRKKISILEFSSKGELVNKIKIWLDSEKELESDYPRFLKNVDKLISSGLGYDYDKKHLEVTSQRMMLLTFYIGWMLELPKDLTLDLVDKAKKKVIM